MGEGRVWRRRRRRRVRRVHGLQFPLHPQQILAWVVMAAFVSLTFGAIIPALRSSFAFPASIVSGLLFAGHLLTHMVALAVDPADPQIRAHNSKQLIPEFDRSLHSHVIENGRCHLCNITITSPRTKHCSACNKCVDVFDHHCKWLNHCIGKRNYRIFIACLITAILACFLVMGFCIAEIVLYYFDREHLAPWEKGRRQVDLILETDESDDTESTITCTAGSPYCHFTVFGATVFDGAFIGILSTLFSVALVVEVLLIHLAAFHAYINYLGLTTYEYIRGNNIRDSTSAFSFNTYHGREENMDPEGAVCGWKAIKRTPTNQITPSSTTDTALLSTPSYDLSTGSRSPRSASNVATLSSSSDSQFTFASRHLSQHNHVSSTHHSKDSQNINAETSNAKPSISQSPKSTLPGTPPPFLNSTVPSLPLIGKSSVTRPGINLRPSNRNISISTDPNMENEIEVRLVSIPRPRPSRRRLRSSVVPHLSPIKECDMASSSPPSLKETYSDSGDKNESHCNSPSSTSNPISHNCTDDLINNPDGNSNIEANSNLNYSVLTSQSSPKTNSFLKSSPLKSSHSQIYPQQSPSLTKHLNSNPATKIFVVNDFQYGSNSVRLNSPSSKKCINPNSTKPLGIMKSPLKNVTALPNSPRLMAHIKGKNVAVTIVNEVEAESKSPVLQNGRIFAKERKATHKIRFEYDQESTTGSQSSLNDCRTSRKSPSKSNSTTLVEGYVNLQFHSKETKTSQNGTAHVELHM